MQRHGLIGIEKICCKFPIALHISDSTLHFLQCPSGRPPWAEKTASATPPFHPPAAQGFPKEYLSASHLYLILLSDVATDCSSFITYPTDKVKHFCKKAKNFGFIVDFCRGCGRLGQPLGSGRQMLRPSHFFMHLFTSILHIHCIQYTIPFSYRKLLNKNIHFLCMVHKNPLPI